MHFSIENTYYFPDGLSGLRISVARLRSAILVPLGLRDLGIRLVIFETYSLYPR